jgi:energy-coupling factor transporter ATP-binding protein EcfA2
MATIRRVTVHRLRNVKPGCTLELHPGLSVLLGQNGTGKTTLLQWMADFLSGHLEAWDKEPYRVEVEMETEPGNTRLRATLENQLTEFTKDREGALSRLKDLPPGSSDRSDVSNRLTAYIDIENGENRYEIDARPPHLTFRVNGVTLAEGPAALARTEFHLVRGSEGPPVFRCLVAAKWMLPECFAADLKERCATDPDPTLIDALCRAVDTMHQSLILLSRIMRDERSLFALQQLTRFDESLGFFHRVVEGPMMPSPWSFVPPEIGDLVTPEMIKSPSVLQTLTFPLEDVQGFLATAVQLFQYRSADVHLSLAKDAGGPAAARTYGDLRFTFHRHDGSAIGHEALSYGHKRMLSLLYYLALNPQFIIVDELVNGLHHAWIQTCIDEIGDRQGILTSQNPLLLDYLTFESADEVRQRFILCRSERDGETGREQLVWHNPTPEEAESVYSAYQAGIQHLGEILVDKGLW